MASEGKAVWETRETAESDSGIHILDGNVRMIAEKDTCYRLPGPYGEEKKLDFTKAYRIEEYGGDTGIRNCCYNIYDRKFRDLSCMEGRILQELTDQYEIRKHADGTVFLFFCKSTFAADLWDRVWKGILKAALYRDEAGIHLISCRHGYRISEIDVFLGLKKGESEIMERLPYYEKISHIR